MEELKSEVRAIKKAVFGDSENPKAMPGIVNELSSLEKRIDVTNELLGEIQDTIKKATWAIVGTFATIILKIIFVDH